MPELIDAAQAGETEDDLRAALARSQIALAREKSRTADLTAAVYTAAHDAAMSMTLPPVARARRDRRPGGEEVAVLVIGDWQLGKLTPSYNSAVCEERIERLADKVIRLTDIQRADHPVRELRVWMLGDMVEGEMIFPGQSYLIDSSVYSQALRVGPRILGNLVRRMAGHFERVALTGVIGNHGRAGRKGDNDLETNWDRVLYRHTADVLTGRPGMENTTWTIPEGKGESSWYAVDSIGSYSSLLFHGYNLKGGGGMPWYGLQKKVGGWALGAVEEFATALADKHGTTDTDFGHWHQPTRVTLNRVTARCNGSTESHNTFAQEQLAAVGVPTQGLRFVHPGKGRVTAEYTVDLAD